MRSDERDCFYSTLARFEHLGESESRKLAYQASLAIRQSRHEQARGTGETAGAPGQSAPAVESA